MILFLGGGEGRMLSCFLFGEGKEEVIVTVPIVANNCGEDVIRRRAE